MYNKKKGVFDPESEIPDDAETTFENHIHIMDNYNEKWKQKKYTTDLKYIEACKYSKFNNISSSIPNNCKNYVPWKCEKPNSKIIDSYYKKSCENIDDIQLANNNEYKLSKIDGASTLCKYEAVNDTHIYSLTLVRLCVYLKHTINSTYIIFYIYS